MTPDERPTAERAATIIMNPVTGDAVVEIWSGTRTVRFARRPAPAGPQQHRKLEAIMKLWEVDPDKIITGYTWHTIRTRGKS